MLFSFLHAAFQWLYLSLPILISPMLNWTCSFTFHITSSSSLHQHLLFSALVNPRSSVPLTIQHCHVTCNSHFSLIIYLFETFQSSSSILPFAYNLLSLDCFPLNPSFLSSIFTILSSSTMSPFLSEHAFMT